MTTTATTQLEQWADIVIDLTTIASGETLVLGDGAHDLAVVLNRRGAGLPCYWGREDVALLWRDEEPDHLETATPQRTTLADSRLDLVVLRHGWQNHGELAAALQESYRILRPGGGVVAADLAVDNLMDAPPQRYPLRLLPMLYPEVGKALDRSHCDLNQLTVELVRAGFKNLISHRIDSVAAEFADAASHAEFVAAGGWRGLDHLTSDQRSSLVSQLPELVRTAVPLGPIRDAEPWHVARGFKPGA